MDRGSIYATENLDRDVSLDVPRDAPPEDENESHLTFRVAGISILHGGGIEMDESAAQCISPLASLARAYLTACGLHVVRRRCDQDCVVFTYVPDPQASVTESPVNLRPPDAGEILAEIAETICDVRRATVCLLQSGRLPIRWQHRVSSDCVAHKIMICAIRLLRWCSRKAVVVENWEGKANLLPPPRNFPGLQIGQIRVRAKFVVTRILLTGDLVDDPQRRILRHSSGLPPNFGVGDALVGEFLDAGNPGYREVTLIEEEKYTLVWATGSSELHSPKFSDGQRSLV